jgi:hypothetical protein
MRPRGWWGDDLQRFQLLAYYYVVKRNAKVTYVCAHAIEGVGITFPCLKIYVLTWAKLAVVPCLKKSTVPNRTWKYRM